MKSQVGWGDAIQLDIVDVDDDAERLDEDEGSPSKVYLIIINIYS